MQTIDFTLFWLTGETQLVSGVDIASAMNNEGISNGALRALDFYAEGKQQNNYNWNRANRSWDKVLEEQGVNACDL